MAQSLDKLFIMTDETEALWPLFSAKTPEEFYREMTAGLPEGTKIELTLRPDGKLKVLNYRYQKSADKSFDFLRGFDGNSVEHVYGHILPAMRNQGIAKTINGHLFRLYEEIGISYVEISPAKIGAYTWARLGFVPDHEYWVKLRQNISARVDVLEEMHPEKNFIPLRRLLASDDPKSFWQIVDQQEVLHGTTLGKLLSLPLEFLPESDYKQELSRQVPYQPMDWEGIFNMKDKACMARMTAYLYPAKTTPIAQAKHAQPAIRP